MLYTITVSRRDPEGDAAARGIRSDMHDLGLTGIDRVEIDHVYRLEGEVSQDDAERMARTLLSDPVVNDWEIYEGSQITETNGADHSVEVAFNPGVTDPIEGSVVKAGSDMGIDGLEGVGTAKRYRIYGKASEDEVGRAVAALLMVETVQHIVTSDESHHAAHENSHAAPETPHAVHGQTGTVEAEIVELRGVEDDRLAEISRKGGLSLNAIEMREIQAHFVGLDRDPTDIELETLAQTWSEHCVHKTFKGRYTYEEDGNVEEIDNLMRHTVMKATNDLDLPWCVSVFVDDAGIIEFNDTHHLAFKVETHNHPSALEPYGGAGTGIGGVIRDILGVGLGARPVANTDVFCFARPDFPREEVPDGILHPRRIMRGVVSGVRDYGNRIGIPTVNGAVVFDDRYLGNPLVYCGTVGIMPKGCETGEVKPGMKIVLVGGRTGRDGIHGATFSSAELGSDDEQVWSNAVQIGNPIMEKKVIDVLMVARDRRLYSSLTDCGAGGLSSSVGELGEDTGAEVDLDTVPLKYDGLSYTEIWISEAQERMVLAVPPENVDELLALFASEDVEATVIGAFTDTERLVLRYHGVEVGDLSMEFLHDGVPQVSRRAVWNPEHEDDPDFAEPSNLAPDLMKLLADPTIASKEWVIRQYDHEVQGGSVVKPLVGKNNDGPSDASVIQPLFDSPMGVVVANGINPRYGLIDPYWMTLATIDETLRNVVAVGGDRRKTAILDNFCWGNPEVPERLGELVRAARGCYDGAMHFETPFISGKDSFYNEFSTPDGTIAIPPTLLISAVSVVDDISSVITMDLKQSGHFVYLVGLTKPELGGSFYWEHKGYLGRSVPRVDLESASSVMDHLHQAIQTGAVCACHDLSEGGLGVALAEMAFAGDVGVDIDLGLVAFDAGSRGNTVTSGTASASTASAVAGRSDTILFSESPTRWLCEVAPEDAGRFEAALEGVPIRQIGQTARSSRMRVRGISGDLVVDSLLGDLREAWQSTLRSV
jgi:phosphoribosylformylglycinamidine synthase II